MDLQSDNCMENNAAFGFRRRQAPHPTAGTDDSDSHWLEECVFRDHHRVLPCQWRPNREEYTAEKAELVVMGRVAGRSEIVSQTDHAAVATAAWPATDARATYRYAGRSDAPKPYIAVRRLLAPSASHSHSIP